MYCCMMSFGSLLILKYYILPATLHIITSLMNDSFRCNTFARVWKIAEVICVPKDGDDGNPCNNRPMSLLPVLSKVNERLAHRQFVTFLDYTNKLSQSQRGNHKYYSTETALLFVTGELLKAMDKKKISILVLTLGAARIIALLDFISAVQYMIHFIYHFVHRFIPQGNIRAHM